MSTAESHAYESANDGDEQGPDEEIGRHHEGHAGIANTAQIQNGDNEKNPDAKGHGMRLQRGNGRNQRANACGNAHGRSEDVVRQQSCRGEKACEGAQVEARNGVGAAARGIGGNGLAIGKVDYDEERNDGGADGDDVLHTEQAERNQQTEGGFRAVGGGTERVQAEDGDAFLDADLFGALVAGLDGLADNGVENVHSWSGPEKRSLSERPFVTRWGRKSTG